MPTQDNDAEMLRAMGNTITDLQVQYRAASLEDQAILAVPLKEMIQDYGAYQARLLKAGTITSDAELAEMKAIQNSISENATRQELLIAISRIVALIAFA
jgi:hypothetical protein